MNKYTSVASMDDIVFEGRNKAYGAYELRKINPKYAAIATLIAITVFVVGILLSQVEVAFLKKNQDETDISVQSTIVEFPEDVPLPPDAPPPPPPPPPPEAPQIKFVEMVVKKDEEVADKDLATQKELKDENKQVGFENKDGDANAKPKVIEPEAPKYGTGPIAAPKEKEDKVDDNQIFEIVEEQAEFPGGQAAMLAFIQKNLKYPDIALENGIEGTVVVEFVVEKDGSLTDVKVIKDIGAGCGAEAVRVIKMMPKWKPGKQRDMAVRVKMKAPIRFKMSR